MARQVDTTKIERLMQAAVKCINRQGYAVTTISQIAKEAGVSTGYLYSHYASKEELVRAIYNHAIGELDDYIDFLIKTENKVRTILEGFISFVFKKANDDSGLVKFLCLMLYEQSFNIPEMRSKKTAAQCRQLLRKGITSGEIDKSMTSEDIYITFFSIPIKLIELRVEPSGRKNLFSKTDTARITRLCMNAVK